MIHWMASHAATSLLAAFIAGVCLMLADAAVQQANAGDWTTISPGGETSCGFDTPFQFWVRESDPARVLIYLQGGGLCWNHETCHPKRNIRFISAIGETDVRQRNHGIFDQAPTNPFRGYTAIFVPYCTGDFHLGARRTTYRAPDGDTGDDVTVNHAGYHNVRAVLDHLIARQVKPALVVVAGGSAGAVASPIVAAEVAQRLPEAAVRQIGDGAGGLRIPTVRDLLRLWGTDSLLEARGLSLPADGDALAGMYRVAAARQPHVRFMQVNTSSDETVAAGLQLFGQDPTSVAANVEQTYQELTAAGVCFEGYLLSGAYHTVLWRPEFLTETVEGADLAGVISRAVTRPPCEPDVTQTPVVDAAAEAALAANRFLEALTEGQRARAAFGFDADVRTTWAYTPTARPGLPLKQMSPAARARAHDLLRAVLSHAGYLKVNAIMGLEQYLQMVEVSGFPRDLEAYVVGVFGLPDVSHPWGFRFEGHHVSVNFTWAGTAPPAVTPFFFGANPATVPTGPQAGLRVLAREEDDARKLLRTLSVAQRKIAVVSDTVPPDIFTTNAAVALPLPAVGLPMADMAPHQQSALLRLIDVYLGNLTPDLATHERQRVVNLDPRTTRFAWFGSEQAGAPHYYRIQSGAFLIEYDHTSNHVHTVWRDVTRDFGRDLLREHHHRVLHRPRT